MQTHTQALHFPSPIAFALAGLGALLSQVDNAQTGAGSAGLIMSLAALLGAGFQYYKQYGEQKRLGERITEQGDRIASLIAQNSQLQQELIGCKQARIEEAKKVQDTQIAIATLQGEVSALKTMQHPAPSVVSNVTT